MMRPPTNNKGAAMTVKSRAASASPSNNTSSSHRQGSVKELTDTPFKRGRSKVFYASDNDGLAKVPASQRFSFLGTDDKKAINEKTPDHRSAECNERLGGQATLWRSTLDTCKEASEGSSSGDETVSPSGSGIRSPIGSLRSSLGGSLRGSQDSGYSDSGESNSGGTPELDTVESPPRVKHISRVFFGGGSGRARLYSDTIVTGSPPSHSTTPNSCNSLPRRQKSCSTQVECADSYNSSSRSSPTSICDSDEPQYQLENKSILDISSGSYDEQASRKTGAIRKTSYVSNHRKGPRRSSSADKLLDEPTQRRPCILKARRRWSTVDVKAQNSVLNPPQSSYAFGDSTDCERYSSLGTVNEATPKSAQTDQCRTNTIPRKTNIKRLRIHPTAIAAEMKNDSLSQWLVEVRQRVETECMNTLQSKSLATDAPLDPLSAVDAVRAVQRRAHAVSTEFARLCQKLEQRQTGRLPALSRSLVAHINAFLREPPGPSAQAAGPKSALSRQIEVVRQICHRLMELTTASESVLAQKDITIQSFTDDQLTIKHSLPDTDNVSTKLPTAGAEVASSLTDIKKQGDDSEKDKISSVEERCLGPTDDQKLKSTQDVVVLTTPQEKVTKEIAQVVTALGHAFTKLVDIMLSVEIKEVISCLESDGATLEGLRGALRQVTSLGVDGGHVCRLIARLGGVRSLLALCLERRMLRVAALRALATVCCVSDGIAHLEKAGGIEVIVEILCDSSGPEDERSEAAAVLAQITSPWVEDQRGVAGLHPHIGPVVEALTGLVRTTESAEIFLLGSAALANLTCLDGERCVAALLAAGTAPVLLSAAKDSHHLSVFTKDQIATVIASLCSNKQGAEEVSREGGVKALVGLLQTRPPPHPARMPEVTATERVQQKTAIAISRLCGAKGASSEVLSEGGGTRLVALCKDEHERNHSDAVLVACLAALRKIASSCGQDELRGIDAAELVEPRLLDSFLTYSSRQESYV